MTKVANGHLFLLFQPNREDEHARIEAAGGKVIQWNGHRVCGVLAMSRSIGMCFTPLSWFLFSNLAAASSICHLNFICKLLPCSECLISKVVKPEDIQFGWTWLEVLSNEHRVINVYPLLYFYFEIFVVCRDNNSAFHLESLR